MQSLIRFLINKKLLVNLGVLLLVFAGAITLNSINREAFPEVNFDMVTVQTIYPGGSPDELEQLVTIPLEKRLREVDGIDKVRSYNIENVSVIAIYLEDGLPDRTQVVQDIKDAIALEDSLPDKAKKPIIEELKTDKIRVIDIAIQAKSKNVTYRRLRNYADKLEDFLYDIRGVAEVEKVGYLDREYLVEVNPASLKQYRIGLNKVINTLKLRNLDVPGGSLRIGDMEYILRTKGQYGNINEIMNTALMVNDIEYATRIRDVAVVSDTFEEADVLERVNGKESIVLRVWKKKSADEISLMDTIRAQVPLFAKTHDQKIKLELFNDQSRLTRTRISAVLVNAATGLAFLLVILTVLLGRRISIIVAAGIPIAFMAAFIAMKFGDITLNVISLFGMIMVLGMIVDFGIVVTENSFRYMELGWNKLKAIEKGVSEIFWPVTVTLICICAAFAPLLFLTGIIGKFIVAIPIVLIMCLVASWFVAMFVMPAYLDLFTSKSYLEKKIEALKKEEGDFFKKIIKVYQSLLSITLKYRYFTIGVLFVILIGTMGLSGKVGFQFMPKGGEEGITIFTDMPQGTNLTANLREVKKIENIIFNLHNNVNKKSSKIKRKKEIDAIHVTVGEETSNLLDPKPGEATHKSTFNIYLTKENDRDRTATTINHELQNALIIAQKKGIISKKMKIRCEVKKNGPPVGKPVNIEIRGEDFRVIKKIAKEYLDFLQTLKKKGVYNIAIDLEEGKQEFRYKIKDVMAARTGVSVHDAAMALNASFEGAVATSVMRKKDEIKIRVRFPESARRNRNSINDVMIGTQQGGLIPLSMVAYYKKQPGFSQINRLNFKRLVQVQADVDTEKITSVEVNQLLQKKFKNISKKYRGYSVKYGGEKEDSDKSMGEMGVLFIFALLIIYITLSVFFNSLVIPLVVMIAIPFALVGVILALFFHGEPMSFMSTLGLFSLAGVIVSNTLVLVQFINNLRDEGLSTKDALIEGGAIRLRPVLLTSGTTVLALFPTIYGLGGKDYFVAPLALAFGYGLIFATFITLILIPCFYHVADDGQRLMSKILCRFNINISSSIYSCANIAVLEAEKVDEQTGADKASTASTKSKKVAEKQKSSKKNVAKKSKKKMID